MKNSFVLLIVACFTLGALTHTKQVFADDHGKIRMYRMNSKNQLIRQKWMMDGSDTECQNTMKSRDVHRFAQTGYAFCKLYSAENCNDGDELPALWGGRKYRAADIDITQPQLELLEGSEWFLVPEGNVEVNSWICSY